MSDSSNIRATRLTKEALVLAHRFIEQQIVDLRQQVEVQLDQLELELGNETTGGLATALSGIWEVLGNLLQKNLSLSEVLSIHESQAREFRSLFEEERKKADVLKGNLSDIGERSESPASTLINDPRAIEKLRENLKTTESELGKAKQELLARLSSTKPMTNNGGPSQQVARMNQTFVFPAKIIKYEPKDDLEDFLEEFEDYYLRIPGSWEDIKRALILSINTAFRGFVRDRLEKSKDWEDAKSILRGEFGVKGSPRAAFNQISNIVMEPGEGIHYYAHRLRTLCRKLDLDDKKQLRLLMDGLREDLRLKMEIRNPSTFDEAVALAVKWENRKDRAGPAENEIWQIKGQRSKDKMDYGEYIDKKIEKVLLAVEDIRRETKREVTETKKEVAEGQHTLLQVLEDIKKDTKAVAGRDRGRSSQRDSAETRGRSTSRGRNRCYACKKLGHIGKNCPDFRCNYCKRNGHLEEDCYTKRNNSGSKNE